MNLPKDLINLANIFQPYAKLYIVGGAVRNFIMKKEINDYDLCSSLNLDKLLEILSNTKYIVKIKNALLQTATISSENFTCEYACFRKEQYKNEGDRVPNSIQLVSNINEDYTRRDFTCNSIYYDILNDKMIDFTSGLTDIKNKIIKTVKTPNETLSEDSIRILRMVRFSTQLQFDIDKDAYNQAKNFAHNLLKIKSNKKNDELKKIIMDKNYSYGLKCLLDLNIFNYIFSDELKKIQYELKNFKTSLKCNNENLRFYAFIIDLYKQIKHQKDLSAKEIVELVCGNNGLNLKRIEISYCIKLILAHEYIQKNINLRFFISINYSIINDFIKIFENVDYMKDKIYNLKIELNKIKNLNLPLHVKDLRINAKEIFKTFPYINKNKIRYILNQCLINCLEEKINNSKKDLLSYIKKIV